MTKRERSAEAEEFEVVKRKSSRPKRRWSLRLQTERTSKSSAASVWQVYSEFAPEEMSEDEIKNTIQAVLNELGIAEPSARDKGKVMKELMPRVKGRADGSLVNRIVGDY
ncbi:MAG: GatB/YqeY domain-containing protein [Gallintestinimicrobium sp.]